MIQSSIADGTADRPCIDASARWRVPARRRAHQFRPTGQKSGFLGKCPRTSLNRLLHFVSEAHCPGCHPARGERYRYCALTPREERPPPSPGTGGIHLYGLATSRSYCFRVSRPSIPNAEMALQSEPAGLDPSSGQLQEPNRPHFPRLSSRALAGY